ncbi:uncharacterized protein LOC124806691 isoform X3 [Hydra vulgaris]|uniref:Uncharacterized protein LOC124806691 isoform X3 n=1 Tax=Hydra vulgaris TaxID=6087 RepID=A0ABM4C598_HYDVU
MQMIPENDLGVSNDGYTEMESGFYTINNGYTPMQFTVLQNSTKIQARNSVTSLVIKGNSSVTTINQQNTEADGITFYTTTSNDGRYRAKSRQYRVSITPADDVLPPYTALSVKPPTYEKKVYIEEEDENVDGETSTQKDERPSNERKKKSYRGKKNKKCCIIMCIILLLLIILIGGILLVVYSAKSILR